VDEDGDMRQSQDQKSSATTVKNFLNNKKYGVPVALIVGKFSQLLFSPESH